MRTRHQAVEEEVRKESEGTLPSAAKRKGRGNALAEAGTSSKAEKEKAAPKKRKIQADTDIPDAGHIAHAADLIDHEDRDAPKKARITKKKAAKGRSAAAALPAVTESVEVQIEQLQEEVQQPKKLRKGGTAATRKAYAAEPAASPDADTAEVQAAETGASPEALPETKAQDNSASTMAVQAPLGATALPAAGVEETGDDDDDDEAPEEVSLAAGREGAVAARREEREMALRQKRLAKEKGRRRVALAEAERDARLATQQQGPVAIRQVAAAAAEAVQEEGDEEDDDLLPRDVVAAIARRSREAAAAQGEADVQLQPPAAAKKPKKRVDPSQPKRVGPFLVQPLSRLPQAKASEAAQQFVRQQMYGRSVKRSAEMLVPSTARYYGPAVTF